MITDEERIKAAEAWIKRLNHPQPELEDELAKQCFYSGSHWAEGRCAEEIAELKKQANQAAKFRIADQLKDEEKIRKLEAVVEAARGVGMNWKIGAPYGGDKLDEALKALDGVESKDSTTRSSKGERGAEGSGGG